MEYTYRLSIIWDKEDDIYNERYLSIYIEGEKISTIGKVTLCYVIDNKEVYVGVAYKRGERYCCGEGEIESLKNCVEKRVFGVTLKEYKESFEMEQDKKGELSC